MAEAWVAAPIIGYLIGSVPIGLWIGRFVANADLRSDGSGKIGTTNAYRALGLRWALVIFGLDVGKGWHLEGGRARHTHLHDVEIAGGAEA